ncbi:Ribonuclease H1 [Coemansia javaensis]|uniref:ribonuclease H n=1 Tax=Coemansia javaensis TaxID=2761396 RepID=A0A9W8HA36_9FUNG|nr:Ribonuclease H1 [Coemansia javaensis]
MPRAAAGFYAVRRGRRPGVYGTWDECRAQTDGFAGAVFKRFASAAEAQAFVGGARQVVYTDGASSRNGQHGARAGVGVYFGEGDARNVSEPLAGPRQTNQRAELAAVQRAVRAADPGVPLDIRTDSSYSIKSLTEWAPRWERNGWTTASGAPVQNQDLIRGTLADIRARDAPVSLTYVPGHSGVAGNEAADRLAVAGARQHGAQ